MDLITSLFLLPKFKKVHNLIVRYSYILNDTEKSYFRLLFLGLGTTFWKDPILLMKRLCLDL